MQESKELQEKLSPEQYSVCVLGNTEAPFSGEYNKFYEDGLYQCVVCKTNLFSSTSKYDSGSGWPSFGQAVEQGNIEVKEDTSLGMVRTEVLCATCGAHLGHVFDDGPKPTGKRFCINSVALEFVSQDTLDTKPASA